MVVRCSRLARSRPGRARGLGSALALAALGCASFEPGPPAAPPALDAKRIERDVAWLADDAREGRASGSAGARAAAEYITAELRAAGFEPPGDAGRYVHAFELPTGIRVARAELSAGGEAAVRERDFEALLSSDNGRVSGPLVFAGYGITSKEFGYDDYAGIDVRGRAALVLEDRPEGDATPLTGSEGAGFLRRADKIANARRRGAAAVLLVPAAVDAAGLAGSAGREVAAPTRGSSGILALGLSREAAERLVATAGGESLAERQRRIDAAGRPASRVLEGVTVDAAVEIERRTETAVNVVGVLEGRDPELKREFVVVGAHYDHLGRGGYGSLTPDRRGEIHNGADDNASGTAGLLELARALGAAPRGRRSVALVAFAGEEIGLVGSREFVRDGPLPVEDIAAMINLDMIGRLRDRELTVFGSETAEVLPPLVEAAAREAGLELTLSDGGYAPSDQTSFYTKNVPVLFFFTGTHAEYHTPDDDAELVDAQGTADVVRAVYSVTRKLLDAPERPVVVAAPPPPPAEGGGGGYGPYLGTVPDFAGGGGGGVLLQGVRPGSPAAAAGLMAGDRIVEFDGASVENLEEYAALLFASRPGRKVEIVVLRDGRRITTQPTLGQRR